MHPKLPLATSEPRKMICLRKGHGKVGLSPLPSDLPPNRGVLQKVTVLLKKKTMLKVLKVMLLFQKKNNPDIKDEIESKFGQEDMELPGTLQVCFFSSKGSPVTRPVRLSHGDIGLWMDEVRFAPPKKSGMMRFFRKYQETLTSNGFKVVQDLVHPQ